MAILCSECGTQVFGAVEACPVCGAATPSDTSHAEGLSDASPETPTPDPQPDNEEVPQPVKKDGGSPLIEAVRKGYESIGDITVLIEAGAALDSTDQDGNTPLHLAVILGYPDFVPKFIRAGADVNIRNNKGESALVLTAQNGYEDIVGGLVDAGAKIDPIIDETCFDLLFTAARAGSKGIVEGPFACRNATIRSDGYRP